MTFLEKIEEFYGFGLIQDAANILRQMIEDNVSLHDFVGMVDQRIQQGKWQFVEAKKHQDKVMKNLKMNSRRCEECGNLMNLIAVNDIPARQVGGNYQSAWQCINMLSCGHEVYSERSLEEEAKEYKVEEFFAGQAARARRAADQRMRPKR
jgi:hypothetical protein